MKPTPTQLRRLFDYNPLTGELRWKQATGRRRKVGDIAGCASPDDRILVGLYGRLYKAHRIIWAIVTGRWPPHQIDHEDENGLNNRWENLRRATKGQNMQNITITRANTSGFKGVSRNGPGWRASIKAKGTQHHLGTFSTPEEAFEVYKSAAKRLHGVFAKF